MIPITKPYLPDISIIQEFLNGIWERNWLTNHGPLVQEFERLIMEKLEIPNFTFVSNGTLGLQIALKCLVNKKEVLTTPFSYVASSTAILWEGLTPVYVDIDEYTFNIDPLRIEEKISENTGAILATHVYGNPCDIDGISKIASKYSLPVIYDGAHAFGTNYKNKSIFNFGTVSVASFHATKLMHSVEGGGIFSTQEGIQEKIRSLANFGHISENEFEGIGINAKNSEIHSAIGISVLMKIDDILSSRRKSYQLYKRLLCHTNLRFQHIENFDNYNCAYFPIVCKDDSQLKKVVSNLHKNCIYPRRYFYPSLNTLYSIKSPMPNSEWIADRILCLPMYYNLKEKDQRLICRVIIDSL